MPKQAFFITGTDTGVGKTLVTAALIHVLTSRGLRVAGMKPVAAGAFFDGQQWRSEDADALQTASNVDLPARMVTPYLLRQPTAPHIAAAAQGVQIKLDLIDRCYREIEMQVDAVVVEGSGGFMVPLGDAGGGHDLARRLGLPIIMVVGIRLGCINHALLTQQAILANKLRLVGWVANVIDPEQSQAHAMIDSMIALIRAPLLGRLPWSPSLTAETAQQQLTLPTSTRYACS
jgi:dethiobiotin synthetase